tara:strand:- start:820 stop:1815 length:996 start_codon:yes stop_codon:yes gene_type:complete
MDKQEHQEIPQEEFDIEKALDKEEKEYKENETDLMLEPEESLSEGQKPFRLEDDKCIRCLDLLYKLVLALFCITSIISLIKLFTGYSLYSDVYSEVYQRFNEDTTMKLENKMIIEDIAGSSSDSPTDSPTDFQNTFDPQYLSASMTTFRVAYHHNRYRPSADCNDYKFGCCEIYDACSQVYNDLIYNTIKLDPRVIHKHDELGTNCPRMEDLVEDYKKNYGSDDCENSQYGCCEVNFICDIRTWSQRVYNETTEYVIKTYQKNIKDGHVNKNTGKVKIDKRGSNCPSPYNIISEYELGYPENLDSIDISFMLFLLLFFCCLASSGGKRRYR